MRSSREETSSEFEKGKTNTWAVSWAIGYNLAVSSSVIAGRM